MEAYTWNEHLYMSRLARNALLVGGVRGRVGIREQRKIKRSKACITNPLMEILDASFICRGVSSVIVNTCQISILK